MASSRPFVCSVCRESFRVKSELTTHLNETSPSCKTTPKKRNDAVKPKNISPRVSFGSEKLLDAALVEEMEAGMERKSKPLKKSGLDSSILSTIADGDDELVNAYSKIPLNSITGTRLINKEIVNSVTRKAKINMDRIEDIISRTKNISVCFLLDTTGSMSKYISGVKEQVVEIVRLVQARGCEIEGLAFIGKYSHMFYYKSESVLTGLYKIYLQDTKIGAMVRFLSLISKTFSMSLCIIFQS